MHLVKRFLSISKLAFLTFFLAPLNIYCNPANQFNHYELDVSHTKIGFEISHLVIATVDGHFEKFSGSFDYHPSTHELKNAMITIDPASINTNEPNRDKDLRGKNFFEVEKYPKITFEDITLISAAGKPSQLKGVLNMHGIKKEISLNVDFKGAATDPWGNQIIAFNLRGLIQRKDFGLNWNKNLDAGGLMVGEDVSLVIKVEARLKK